MRAVVICSLLLAPLSLCAQCVGDCDDSGDVSIEELVLAVSIVLGDSPLESCGAADADGDGEVFVDEVIAAVANSLDGCGPFEPTAEPTPPPTPTPEGPRCGNGVVEETEECDDGNQLDGDGCTADCRLEPVGDVCAGVHTVPGNELRARVFVSGLQLPVFVGAAHFDPHRVFVVEQPGRIRLAIDGVLLSVPFLNIADRVSCCGERGLLSFAFHPRHHENRRFFINYTDRAGDTVVASYEVSDDPNRADPDSERIILRVRQTAGNHNGGQIAFGPDGYLYVGMGDGGGAGDPFDAAQDDATLLGKLLRLDVDVEESPHVAVPPSNPNAGAGLPLGLIWAKGLRNPWRFSFDRVTGDLYIADVGQGRFEEVSVQPATSAGGENYGWRIFEGESCFRPLPGEQACPDPSQGFTPPVLVYPHPEGCSVTGGFVYRGCSLPALHGTYFYSDYCTGFLRSFNLEDGQALQQRDWTAEVLPPGVSNLGKVTSFGEDARGEIYVAQHGGTVYKLEAAD
jgi:cysteine-rich repeat protein